MSFQCIISGLKVDYPCSPICNLYADCVVAFFSAKKEKVQTNADRIRAMSDEELADFLGLWAARHHAWMCDGSGEVLHYLRENAK